VHGGMKFYRGSAAAARAYVEADHSRADDYYLAEGSGVAARYVVDVSDSVSPIVRKAADLDGETYERWVAGYDVDTGRAKGRLRDDANALRFVEVTVNGPKTWSLAAALHPQISAALDAAQDRAAEQICGWVAEHATTRVGPRGRQVQIPVEQIEAAVIRHYTSRAGDPHRHLHLQINARVFSAGAWRGIHSVGMRDSLEAINGIGHQRPESVSRAEVDLDPVGRPRRDSSAEEVVVLGPDWARQCQRGREDRPVIGVPLLNARQSLGLVVKVDLRGHRENRLPQLGEIGQRIPDVLGSAVLGEDRRQMPLRVVVGDLGREELCVDGASG